MTTAIQNVVQYVPINQLVPLQGNPRKIKDKAFMELRESLKAIPGFFEARPIIASDRTGVFVIIAGNQRYHAAVAEGIEEVPACILSGLTKEEEDEITYRDNEHSGEWDMKSFNEFFSKAQREKWGLDIQFSEEDEEFEKQISSFNNKNAEYPIVPKFSEKYRAIIIVVENEIDETFMKNALELEKSQSYKNNKTGTSYIIDVKKFRAQWESK
jgi:hypothetical protein